MTDPKRKSMDEVLTSIRNIIRADRGQEDELDTSNAVPAVKAVMDQARGIDPGPPEPSQPNAGAVTGFEDPPALDALELDGSDQRAAAEALDPEYEERALDDTGPADFTEPEKTDGAEAAEYELVAEAPMDEDDAEDLSSIPPLGAEIEDEPEDEPGIGAMTMEELDEMVRRIVREEFTGEMGKRMTLNVQKLIRAEIAKSRR